MALTVDRQGPWSTSTYLDRLMSSQIIWSTSIPSKLNGKVTSSWLHPCRTYTSDCVSVLSICLVPPLLCLCPTSCQELPSGPLEWLTGSWAWLTAGWHELSVCGQGAQAGRDHYHRFVLTANRPPCCVYVGRTPRPLEALHIRQACCFSLLPVPHCRPVAYRHTCTNYMGGEHSTKIQRVC